MRFKSILLFLIFLVFISVLIFGYFFVVVPLQLENKDLKRENEFLVLKISKELESLNTIRKDTLSLNLPEPLLKAKEELSKEFKVIPEGNLMKVVILTDEIFLPGNYVISKQGEEKLSKLAKIIKEFPYKELEIQVHTDNVPVQTKKDLFPTNWELSARRGTEIVRFLITKENIPPERIYASAFGDSRPLVNENTKEAREKNRRAEFIIKF
ncbi:MAG: OmpA family protein [candidate division WOR-3 bacterium]